MKKIWIPFVSIAFIAATCSNNAPTASMPDSQGQPSGNAVTQAPSLDTTDASMANQPKSEIKTEPKKEENMSEEKISMSNEEWKNKLSSEEYRVLREHGTERAFTGEFYDHHEHGVYLCAACKSPLFTSETKFESGTGWPSYYAPLNEKCVEETKDASLGMVRNEVHCAKCGGHLGHVFDDGPNPTGLRYCINSISLDFEKK
ncbi:MAG: peptide-methionine (R)-S-oxide reductase MsrB [Flavobacteriales bacterium]